MSKELVKAYEPQKYEDQIYKRWEKSGFFNPDNCIGQGVCKENASTFSIVLPPPNVTGTLHMGHAAMLAIQDIMIRYHRMKGDRTLWLPGTDHAAIATQTKVEKLLMERGVKDPKKELGREKFLAEVDQFAKESHDTIVNQCKRMGSSLDWSREAFTFDEKRNLAVRTVFKKMYDDGLIYRGYRIVNWCPRCNSTLADDEVEYKEQAAKLYTFRYAKDFPIAIATTRPETKLGDTAVAVNPKDKRYKKYIGQEIKVSGFVAGPDLWIKIIGDETVDMKFGTGAVGVTPAHSLADYEMYQRHKLALIKVVDENGKMTDAAGKVYSGLPADAVRKKIVAYLRKHGLLEGEEDIPNNLSICYRCGAAIEPLPSEQWFIDVNKEFFMTNSKLRDVAKWQMVTLKKLMQTVVKSCQIEIIPNRFNKTYFNWIDNLRDWCISRQIWYGHQIPVWYKTADKDVHITFIKHGTSEANLKGVVAGHSESSLVLTKEVKQKLIRIRDKLANEDYAAVFSSDLSRAKETAKFLFPSQKIIIEKRLRGINFGSLIGASNKKVNKYRITGFPNGENYDQVKDRTLNFLSDLIDRYAGKKIVIIAHSGTWKVLENIFNGQVLDYPFLISHATKEPVEYRLKALVYVGINAPIGIGWRQDVDTLDTWFSSGLWTFSTLGYPDPQAGDFKDYHPTSVMETGYDILFFWVARMILMTTYVLGDIPFKKVYLHGLVRDEKGQKMSKSLGNVIDPLDMIKKYGADATRLSLLLGNTPGNDMKLSEEKIAGFRNFANKLWNISRFILTQIDTNQSSKATNTLIEIPAAKTLADTWILERLKSVGGQVTDNIEKFNFSYAGEMLRDFTWGDLADWYLEIAKIEGNKAEILNYLLNTTLKLWHPFMPFVTESIWHQIAGEDKMLMVEKWPAHMAGKPQKKVIKDFDLVRDVIAGIRSLRADYKIEPAKKLNAVISASKNADLLKENQAIIKGLARLDSIKIEDKVGKPDNSVGFIASGIEIYIDITGVVDISKENDRLSREIKEVEEYADDLKKKLANKDFIKNAPREVVDKERCKLGAAKEKLIKLRNQLSSIV